MRPKARGWSSSQVALSQDDHNMSCVPHLKLVTYHGNLKTLQPITMKNKIIFTTEKNGVVSSLAFLELQMAMMRAKIIEKILMDFLFKT